MALSKMKTKVPKRLPRYEKRVVLFIDFLGFKDLVKRTKEDQLLLARIVKAQKQIGKIGSDDVKSSKSQRVTQFSDCVAVSFHVNERSAVFWLLNEIAICVISLVEQGFLLRGALTVGELLHTSKHIIGPAFVKAYKLETEDAKFPRILIDEEVLRIAQKAHSEHHTPKEEAEYVGEFMTKDIDGSYLFDYVSWNSVVAVTGGTDQSYPDYLKKLGKLIETGLGYSDSSILEKYLWIHKQYVDAIELFEKLLPDNAYRLNNPESCAQLESLPKYKTLAKNARNLVDISSKTAANS